MGLFATSQFQAVWVHVRQGPSTVVSIRNESRPADRAGFFVDILRHIAVDVWNAQTAPGWIIELYVGDNQRYIGYICQREVL